MPRSASVIPRLPASQKQTGVSVLASNTVLAGVFNGDFAIGSGSRSTDGWVGSEAYGWYVTRATFPGTSNISYDTVAGKKCMTIEGLGLYKSGASTSLIGVVNIDQYPGGTITNSAQRYLIPVTAGDVIRISFKVYIHYNNKPGNIVARIGPTCYNASLSRTTPSYSWTDVQTIGQWVDVTEQFTVSAGCSYLTIAAILASNPGGADFTSDNAKASFADIKVEKVLSITNPGTKPSPYLPAIQAVTSVDAIDQNLDSTGAYANTYTPPTSVNEGATHRQTFTPTQDSCSLIGVKIVSKGTGRMRIVVHDSSNNAVGGSIDPNTGINSANLVDGQFNYFGLAGKFVVGQTYHFHILSTVADGTIATNVANDLEACSFIEQFGRKTDSIFIENAARSLRISPDEDGLLHGSILDLAAGIFTYRPRYPQGVVDANWVPTYLDIFECGGYSGNTFTGIANGLMVSSAACYATTKVNMIYPVKAIRIRFKMAIAATRSAKYQYSYDNVNWNDFGTYDNTHDAKSQYVRLVPPTGTKIIYLRWQGVSQTCYLTEVDLEADLDLRGFSPLMLPAGASSVYFSSLSVINNAYRSPSLQFIVPFAKLPTIVATTGRAKVTEPRTRSKDMKKGLLFAGGSDVVTSASGVLDANGNHSLSFRVKPNRDCGLFSIWGTNFRIDAWGGNFNMSVQDASNVAHYAYILPIPLKRWSTIVITTARSEENLRIYINNVLKATVSLPGGIRNLSGQLLKFGRSESAVTNLIGKADEVRAWNRKLTTEEVKAETFGGSVSNKDLALEWLFDEASGSQANDTSGKNNHGAITGATYNAEVPIIGRTKVT